MKVPSRTAAGSRRTVSVRAIFLVICTVSLTGVAASPSAAVPIPTLGTTLDRGVADGYRESGATCSRAAALAEAGARYAASRDVTQSVAVVDRRSGVPMAAVGADRGYNTESLLKTFTATYYLTTGADAGVSPGALRELISRSDNAVQTDLWTADIVPTIADRYGLTNTRTSSYPTSGNWGSDRTTAADQARFLAAVLDDPAVGPSLSGWLRGVTPVAADGFDQHYGLATQSGDRGAKQGWSDPGWEPANLHSVGWVDDSAIAILQTSPTASYATMRSTSTVTATLLAADARCDSPARQTSQLRAV